MSRYIDAEWLEELFPDTGEGEWTYNVTALGYIDSAPSIDLVRCKECKHRYDDGWLEPRWTCYYLKDMRLKDDDFCSYGERKESE